MRYEGTNMDRIEDIEERAEEQDARDNPADFGLDEDGWPNAREFNAIVWDAAPPSSISDD